MGNIIVKLGAYSVLAAGAFVYLSVDKQNTLEEYNVTEAEQSVFRQCDSAMSSNKVEFKNGASQNDGCACITKHASYELTPVQFSATGDIISLKMTASKKSMNTKDSSKQMKIIMETIEKYDEIQAKRNLTADDMTTALDKVSEYTSLCGSGKSHSDENVAIWASYPSKAFPVPVQIAAAAPAQMKLRK